MSSASLPPRQSSSQRRPSPEQTTSSTPSPPATSPSLTRTDDSDPLVLQQPQESTKDSIESQAREESSHDIADGEKETSSAPDSQDALGGTAEDDGEPKKCWICFADSTEDTPATSPWRDPCPCALIAHEECLLDWIADMEAPNRARSRPNGGRIECPQCKTEIKLSRPRSLIVEAVRGLERVSARLVTPGALTVLFGTLYHSSVAWGIHSIYAVFGAEDGSRLLEPLLPNRVRTPINLDAAAAQDVGQAVFGAFVDHLVHWRLYVGLPLITPILILSRTGFADTLLPTLPIAFFASQAHSTRDMLQIGKWPPTAPFAFAMLPYVRALYNYYYMVCWDHHEQRWLREIQPRAGHDQDDEDVAAAEQNIAEREDGNVFEIRIDGWENWDEEDQELLLEEAERLQREREQEQQELRREQRAPNAPQDNQQDGRADPAQAPVVQPNGGDQAPQPADQPAAEDVAAIEDAIAQRERRLSFSPTAIAETVIGALLFPSIAGYSGDLLKLVLPRSWTSPAASAAVRKGLLQEKWGRTIVGGCLLVFFKDAVMLYVRWKMAQMHRQRRVLDYDRSKAAKKVT